MDYHPPTVERLWTDVEFEGAPCRVFLHVIHPCEPSEALFHPHPWPSAMRVIDGVYEMAVGFGSGMSQPPVAARILLAAGSCYEMGEPDSWHAVRPLDRPSWSLMVTGAPWARESHKPTKRLGPLLAGRAQEIFDRFKAAYPG